MKLRLNRQYIAKLRISIMICLLGCLGLCPAVLAQVETADVLGRVSDSSHAVVQGAAVTVTSIDTGAVHQTKSNNSGEFVVPSLPIGRYTVKIESEGFETYSIPVLTLSQGDRARVDATLVIGATVVMEVGAAEPQLQTDSSVVGTVVTERRSHATIRTHQCRPELGCPVSASRRSVLHLRQQGTRNRTWHLRDCRFHEPQG